MSSCQWVATEQRVRRAGAKVAVVICSLDRLILVGTLLLSFRLCTFPNPFADHIMEQRQFLNAHSVLCGWSLCDTSCASQHVERCAAGSGGRDHLFWRCCCTLSNPIAAWDRDLFFSAYPVFVCHRQQCGKFRAKAAVTG